MVKTKQTTKLQKRDWAIGVLFLAVIGTNLLWYQNIQSLNNRLEPESLSNYQQAVQIQKLKLCIDENTRPCDATPPEGTLP